MRYRHAISWLALFTVLGIGSWTWGGEFWNRFKKDTHRNNYWPEPFVTGDRLAVREPFAIQANNGWRLQNTIGDGYFEPETQELNLAGQMKVKWVVTQSPSSRRTVFVMAAPNDEATMVRVDSVQRAISRHVPKGELPEVLLTDPEVRELCGHEGVRDLLLWHALEESEHKAVAFDVYRAVGGGERSGGFSFETRRCAPGERAEERPHGERLRDERQEEPSRVALARHPRYGSWTRRRSILARRASSTRGSVSSSMTSTK